MIADMTGKLFSLRGKEPKLASSSHLYIDKVTGRLWVFNSPPPPPYRSLHNNIEMGVHYSSGSSTATAIMENILYQPPEHVPPDFFTDWYVAAQYGDSTWGANWLKCFHPEGLPYNIRMQLALDSDKHDDIERIEYKAKIDLESEDFRGVTIYTLSRYDIQWYDSTHNERFTMSLQMKFIDEAWRHEYDPDNSKKIYAQYSGNGKDGHWDEEFEIKGDIKDIWFTHKAGITDAEIKVYLDAVLVHTFMRKEVY